MKIIGRVLSLAGLVGVLYFGYEAYNKTNSVKAFGETFSFGSTDYTPLIISAVVLLVGVFLSGRK